MRQTKGFTDMRRIFLWLYCAIAMCRPADDFSLFKLLLGEEKTLKAFEYIVIYRRRREKTVRCLCFGSPYFNVHADLNTSLAYAVSNELATVLLCDNS